MELREAAANGNFQKVKMLVKLGVGEFHYTFWTHKSLKLFERKTKLSGKF